MNDSVLLRAILAMDSYNRGDRETTLDQLLKSANPQRQRDEAY
jgi:hypothetical protein